MSGPPSGIGSPPEPLAVLEHRWPCLLDTADVRDSGAATGQATSLEHRITASHSSIDYIPRHYSNNLQAQKGVASWDTLTALAALAIQPISQARGPDD